jgi:pimeloyl-ACP methyl ester carboxylesterase
MASTGGVFTVNEFSCITVDKTGKVWAGSTLGGLYYFRNNAWKKSYAYGDITFLDIMSSNISGDNSVWAASSGNLNQATTGGVYYIDPLFDFQLFDYRITRYGTGSFGGLSSRLASSLAMNNGFIYVGLDRQSTTNEGGVYRMSMQNPTWPDSNSFTKVNIDIGAGISYKVLGSRGCETWFGKNNYCSGTCAAGRIFRYGNNGYFNIPALSANTTPIPFSTSPGTTNVRAIFTDPSTNFTYVGLSAGAGIAIRNANKFESSLDVPNWTMVTPANSALPANTIVNFNAITKVGGEIWIGTNKGIFVYTGCDTLHDPKFFKMLTTANGLPSDNITDIAFDPATSQVWITSPVGVSTCTVSNLKACEYQPFQLDCKIKPELVWDNSYSLKDNPMAKPIGVAADGVARIYIKVLADANSTGNLRSARVVIMDNPEKTRSMRGKVRVVLNQDNFYYSEEANFAHELGASSDIYPDGRKEIRFWYVAPDDFCYDSTMAEAGESSRIEKVRVYSDYTNRESDYTDIEIQIVRPPLVLVHGLASGPETWKGFKPGDNGIPFVSNPIFKQVEAFTMNGKGSFEENALTLLDKGSMNGLSHPIRELRKKGYASNQVDYVCHSMGALMLRRAINEYPQWYKSWLPLEASTYRKGYVHKLITINSPHNSAPVADIITKLAPNLPEVARIALTGWYIATPNAQIPFNFFEPKPESMFLKVFTTFMATPAVINLQDSKEMGGINFAVTEVRNHIITGNVGLDIDKNPQIIEFKPLVEILSFMADVARNYAITPAEKLFYTMLNAETKLVKAWKFFNYYNVKFGYPDFLKNSDLIVPLKSQLAGQDESLPHITNFPNLETFYDASHVHILKRNDVGKKVLNLLNERSESPLFRSVIPANLNPEPSSDLLLSNSKIGLTQNSNPIITTTFGKSAIEIVSPASGGPNLLADSTLNITINLKDTVGLAYIKIYFQNNDTATISRASNQAFSFLVNPEFSDSQNIMAVAVYDKPTQIEYHVDTLVKIIQLNGVPDSFRVRVDSFLVPLGQVVYPDFEARYNGKWIRIGNNNPAIGVTFQDTAILGISFNNGFLGKKAGLVKAYASYLQFKDTIRFEILPGLFSNNLNVTKASGSFKDSAIWTRGVVPSFLDSVVIETGHDIVLDTTVIIRKLLIKPGGSIKVNGSGDTLYIGFGLDEERFFGSIKIPKQIFQNVSSSIAKRHLNVNSEKMKTEGILQEKKRAIRYGNGSFGIKCCGSNAYNHC